MRSSTFYSRLLQITKTIKGSPKCSNMVGVEHSCNASAFSHQTHVSLYHHHVDVGIRQVNLALP